MIWIVFLLLSASFLTAMAYVYAFRGQERFTSLREYLRKGWPIFAPLNCVLYFFTRPKARKPILGLTEFPQLSVISENWQEIKAEALALNESRVLTQTSDAESLGQYDVGFRTFQKYGWKKFYLKWYGVTLHSATRYCPRTVALLDQAPIINGAMFAMLPGNSQLTRHLDPFAISLRFHFGLDTPNDDRCFISVDGQTYSWRDGQGFVFDETYIHFVRNDTDQSRLILMCDIERPLWGPGSVFSALYKVIGRASVVPNLPGDQRGLGNLVFASVAPVIKRTKQLKVSHRWVYNILKYSLNLAVVGIPLLAVALIVNLVIGGN